MYKNIDNILISIISPIFIFIILIIILFYLFHKISDNCDEKYSQYEAFSFVFNIIINITFLFTIFGLLFMFYISNFEIKTINNEFQENISQILLNELNKLNNTQQQEIKNIMNTYQQTQLEESFNYYCNPDEITFNNNVWLFRIIFIIIIFLIVILLVIYIIIRQLGKCINFSELLGDNILIYFGVSIIVFLIFYYVLSYYIHIQPSLIIKYITSNIFN